MGDGAGAPSHDTARLAPLDRIKATWGPNPQRETFLCVSTPSSLMGSVDFTPGPRRAAVSVCVSTCVCEGLTRTRQMRWFARALGPWSVLLALVPCGRQSGP